MKQSHEYYLERCIEVSKHSREAGNTPFGALLVDAEGNILMEQENVEISTHKQQGMQKLSLLREHLWNIAKNFYGIVHYIQQQSHVQCVQEQCTGQISELLYMQ